MLRPKLLVTFVLLIFRDDRIRLALSSESMISVFGEVFLSMIPSVLIALRNALVLGLSNPNSSMITILPSRSLSESAERIAPRRIFLGIWYDQSRGCGPCTLPPPFHRGDLSDATRARPVPF